MDEVDEPVAGVGVGKGAGSAGGDVADFSPFVAGVGDGIVGEQATGPGEAVAGEQGVGLGVGEGQGDLVGEEGFDVKPQVLETFVGDLGEGVDLAGLESQQAERGRGGGGAPTAIAILKLTTTIPKMASARARS